ncbi:MAG: putative dithiol-disulfide isomerase [Frankiales bacterium]|nr:putative dithiol-disulfide isomerase [Frankiales bacterium]
MQVEIWSDVVCPWCYIGKRHFEAALARFAHADEVQVTYRAFELDPSTEKGVTEPTSERLARKYGQSAAGIRTMQARVIDTAARAGLDYSHLGETTSGNTLDVHRVLQLAAAQGRADAAWEAFYRAYFVEARPIFSDDDIVAVAVEAGLDGDDVRAVLAGDGYTDTVAADIADARSLGVTGVPFFVADRRYGVSGAQPADVLLAMLEQAWNDAHPVVMVAGADDDASCVDGSCAV